MEGNVAGFLEFEKGRRKSSFYQDINLFDDKYRLITSSQFDFGGKEYLYFPEGVNYITIRNFTGKKLKGRNIVMSIACQLYHLNSDLPFDDLVGHIYQMTINHFKEEYRSKSVQGMCDAVVSGYDSGEWKPRSTKRKLIFNPNGSLSSAEKRRVNAQLNLASEKISDEEFDEYIFEKLKDETVVLKRNMLAKELGVSPRTVTRHWYRRKSDIQQHNAKARFFLDYCKLRRAFASLIQVREGGGYIYPTYSELFKASKVRRENIAKLKPYLLAEIAPMGSIKLPPLL